MLYKLLLMSELLEEIKF